VEEKIMSKTFTLDSLGYELVINKFAKQADGTAWLKRKGTVVLSTAVMSEVKDFPGFLPLSVDYREQFAAAGKIPGGYLKREGKSSDKEVLISRLIDRSIRPLFPSYFFNQVQALTTVYSVDPDALPATQALLATSISLVISKIPFIEPVGAIEIGRIAGKWIINPTHNDSSYSDVALIVAGTKDGICMVEGSSDGLSEEELIEALFVAHESIKIQVAWQEEIAKEMGIQKDQSYVDPLFDWKKWENEISQFLKLETFADIFAHGHSKELLSKTVKDLEKKCFGSILSAEITLTAEDSRLKYLFDCLFKDILATAVVDKKVRVDGRDFSTVRKIETEVGILPSVHGSALFQRGETQALVTATLGSGKDVKKQDDLLSDDVVEIGFMLHYNFPPFSVGEVKPLRGPGRREVGHGYLASSAIQRNLPERDSFPYTIRVVSDILESNGSSSMATVCGTTMALMNAGVPMKNMVSGVAMGLLQGSNGEFHAITDITGFEDALGLMDFKVAGTHDKINAIQMDIKFKGGLSRSVFEAALAQAKNGKNHILSEMSKVMDRPSNELSLLVPRMISFEINPNKIGAVIGSGGKIIKEIIEKTGTSVDIEGSKVNIFGKDVAAVAQAETWVRILADQIDIGIKIPGEVSRIADFGLFVDIAPGKSGLVHISKIPRNHQNAIDNYYKPGDSLMVEILDYEVESGKIRLGLVSGD